MVVYGEEKKKDEKKEAEKKDDKAAKKDEGYLFPDTYFISPIKQPQDIVDMMKGNFQDKIMQIQKQIFA